MPCIKQLNTLADVYIGYGSLFCLWKFTESNAFYVTLKLIGGNC